MRIGLVVAILLNSFFLEKSQAQSADTIALLQDVPKLNSRCRGGSGNDNETWKACGARDYVIFLLFLRGYCLGKEGQANYQMSWHKCEENSSKAILPSFLE